MWLLIIVIIIIYLSNTNKKKTVKKESDYEYITKMFPNMLESFEEVYKIFSTHKEEFVYKYRTIRCVYVVGSPENSCYRLQIECGQYPDDTWRNFFSTGWDVKIINGKHIIYKNIYIKYGTVWESGHDWFLDRIIKIHPDWSRAGDGIYMDNA